METHEVVEVVHRDCSVTLSLATQHLILRPEWPAREQRLEAAQPLKQGGKNKQKIGPKNLEAPRLQEPSSFRWGKRYGIAIEGNVIHDIPRPRIPGVVFPEGPQAPRP